MIFIYKFDVAIYGQVYSCVIVTFKSLHGTLSHAKNTCSTTQPLQVLQVKVLGGMSEYIAIVFPSCFLERYRIHGQHKIQPGA